MKVTSLKDVETYVYSSVIMPLKRLNVPLMEYPSPITGESGSEWKLYTRQATPQRHYRRQYQRTQAQRRADDLVILNNGSREYVIASYNRKTHWVKLYERPFRRLKALILFGKLQDAFSRSTPFTKVIVEKSPPVTNSTPLRPSRLESPDDEDSYEADDDDWSPF